VTAIPHPIETTRGWRLTPTSPLAAAEMAGIVILALIVAGIAVGHARAAMQTARQDAAAAEIRILDPTVAAYGLDHAGFAGMTRAVLQKEYGAPLDSMMTSTLEVTATSASSYCIQIRDGAWYAGQRGPSAPIETSQSSICH
jgi:hypothetical protein